MDNENALPWTHLIWQAEAHAWIYAELGRLGLEPVGEIEQFHVTLWSTVMRVPTPAGPAYFKAVAPTMAFEPALTRLLAERRPEHMPQVLAVEALKGWILTTDMGETLRVHLRRTRDLESLRQALPDFARLQIEMAAHTAEVASLGVPVRTLAEITAGFTEICAQEALLSSSEYALTPEQQARLRQLQPRVEALAREVSAAGLPLTLHHDDFHDANIFLKDGRVIFSDWGDCVITHPFFSLLILMRGVADTLSTPENAPEILALRDAYLAPWADLTGQEAPVALFEQAWRLGMLNRVLSWYHYLHTLEESQRARYAYTVPGWLQDFLEIMES